MLQKYMTDWNVLPLIAPVKSVPNFSNLIDVVNKAYTMELNLLYAYNDNSRLAFQVCLSTFDFLQTLRNIQVSSVAEYSDLLNAANLVNVSNSFEILYFEQTYFNG